MASVRERIRMSESEARQFLGAPHKLQLATINPDGTPHLVTMYYALFGDQVGFWTYRTSQKALNLERDPRCSCLVEAGDGYDQLRGVSITGRVEVVAEEERVLAMGRTIYGRYVDEDLDGPMGDYLADQARKRNAYLVVPERITSWDHRKLAAAYAS